MKQQSQIINKVDAIYHWLNQQLNVLDQSCSACGDCCDFEMFGHRLYVTTPELMFFLHYEGPQIKTMTGCVCPYRINGRCSVYPYRFAGCRIFTCKGNAEKENALCEQAVHKFKALCEDHGIAYFYIDLKTGLKWLSETYKLKIDN